MTTALEIIVEQSKEVQTEINKIVGFTENLPTEVKKGIMMAVLEITLIYTKC
jgi:hypothetical protein